MSEQLISEKMMSPKESVAAVDYQVKLPLFEGPLDLLLFLIQRDQIDIYDIPIARITEEYLKYVKLMRLLQLDVAAEFLVMAATLMSIKSQLLLPQPAPTEDLQVQDPRQELVERLLEYKLFKTAAQTLAHRENESMLLYARPGQPQVEEDEQKGDLIEVTLFELLSAFEQIIEGQPTIEAHEVKLDEVTVRQQFDYILRTLDEKGKMPFEALFQSSPRIIVMVVTFLALLELIRTRLVSVRQRQAFGKIWIYRRQDTQLGEHPFEDGA